MFPRARHVLALPQVTDSVGYELALRRFIAELEAIAGALPAAAEPPATPATPAEQAAAEAAPDGSSSGGTAAGQEGRGQGSMGENGRPAVRPVPLEALPGELLQKWCGEVLDRQTLSAAYRWGRSVALAGCTCMLPLVYACRLQCNTCGQL